MKKSRSFSRVLTAALSLSLVLPSLAWANDPYAQTGDPYAQQSNDP